MAYAFFFVAWLQPLHLLPWPDLHTEIVAFIGVFAFFFTASAGRNRGSGAGTGAVLQINVLSLVMLMLPVFAGAQMLFGLPVYGGDVVLLYLYAACAALSVSLGGRVHLEALFAAAIGAAVLNSFISVAQCLDVLDGFVLAHQAPMTIRPGGNLAQPNQLATLIDFSVAALLYLWRQKRLTSFAALLLGGVLLLGLATTESRTGYVGFIAVAVGFLLLAALQRRCTVWLVLVFVGAVLLLTVLFMGWPALLAKYHNVSELGHDSRLTAGAGVRVLLWGKLIDAALQQPLMGWGYRGISYALISSDSVVYLGGMHEYAHNVLIDVVINFGFPALLLFIVVFLLVFCKLIYGCVRDADGVVLVSLLPFIVQSLLEYPFAYGYFLFPFSLLLGYLMVQVRFPVLSVDGRVAKGVCFLSFLLAVLVALNFLMLESGVRCSRFRAAKIGGDSLVCPELGWGVLTNYQEFSKYNKFIPSISMGVHERGALRRIALRHPQPGLLNRYAVASALAKDDVGVREALTLLYMYFGTAALKAVRDEWSAASVGEYAGVGAYIYVIDDILHRGQ